MKTTLRESSTLIMLAACMLVVSGCKTASLKQVSAFGTATQSVAENTEEAIASINEITVKRNIHLTASRPDQALRNEPISGLFEGNAIQQNIDKRVELLNAAGQYANSLKKLAEADFQGDINDASEDLHDSLTSLNNNYKELSGNTLLSKESISLLATIVDTLGDAIVEKERRAAIKKITKEANTPIQNSMNLVIVNLRVKMYHLFAGQSVPP